MRLAQGCLAGISAMAFCLLFLVSEPLAAQDAAPATPPAAQQATPAEATPSAPPATAPADTAATGSSAQAKPNDNTKPAAPAQTAAPAVSQITQAAVQAGVLKSASRINQVVGFLAGKHKSSAYLFTPKSNPDISVFSVSLGVHTVAGQQQYASASFVPLATGVSAAVYDTVEYSDKPPAELEKGLFKNLRRKGTIGKDIIALDAGPVTVFLMPAGTGAVVIKKEVVQ